MRTTILGEARALAVPSDPYPRNAFFAHLIPFLDRIAAPRR